MRWKWIFVFTAAVGLGAFCLLRRPAPELSYEGKPLDRWLEAGYEDASRVLYEVGPRAIPGVFGKLKREHPRYGWQARYRALWERTPVCCRRIMPRAAVTGFDEWRACQCLLAIGPQAIPTLCVSLQNRHFLVRSVSAQTLGLLRKQGANISRALPALEAALQDPDPGVRAQAAAVLGVSQRSPQTAERPQTYAPRAHLTAPERHA